MKKFAIYKSETGFYYYEYCDSIDSISDPKFKNIITEDKLPVVFDGNGGYYHFTENDYGFVEVIETDKEIPLPLEKMFFKNDESFKLGWMSPEGDTYSCNYTNHEKAAKMIATKFYPDCRNPERTLGKSGWLKIIDSWNGTERCHQYFVYSFNGRITKRQADKLYDLGLYKNQEVQRLIKDNEERW